MKRIKLNKAGRRSVRILGTLIGIWLLWSIYYFSTWTKYPFVGQDPNQQAPIPLTEGIANDQYATEIAKATNHLKQIPVRLEVPSFSVAVGNRGKVIWSAAVGYQDLTSRTPATPKTQYRVGSTSKAITTTGVARLVDRGELQLDAPLGDTLVNWTKKRWDFSMKQLLSHTAGVGNYEDFGLASARYTLCNCKQFNTASEGMIVFNRYPLLYEPGTSFQYSTFDINLASVVLEQAADQPFLDYMEASVFSPLGMTDTYGDHAKPNTKHFATFYESEGGYYREYRNLWGNRTANLSYKWAGGGFISTPTDLVKMGNAYLADSTFLSWNTKRTFWTPVKLSNGKVNEQEYALGWRSYTHYQNETFLQGAPIWMVHHGGVSKGSMNLLILLPNYDLVIDASINARAASFGDFAYEVRQLANFFLEHLDRDELEIFGDITAALME